MLLDTDPNGPDFIWKLLFLGIDCFAVFLTRVQTLIKWESSLDLKAKRGDYKIWTWSLLVWLGLLGMILKLIATLINQKHRLVYSPVEVYWKHLGERNIEDVWKSSVRRRTGYEKPVDHHLLITDFFIRILYLRVFIFFVLPVPSGTIGTNLILAWSYKSLFLSFQSWINISFLRWTITSCPINSPFILTLTTTPAFCIISRLAKRIKRKIKEREQKKEMVNLLFYHKQMQNFWPF